MALEESWSLLVEDGVFVPLPEDQQMTEDTLLLLESQIAHSSRKHEIESDMSVMYARQTSPCMSGPTLSLQKNENNK